MISAKHLVGRLRVLPDEIFQARKILVEETRNMARLKARVADLESELLTKPDSPINGKNEQLRDAQLRDRLKVWDIPLIDQGYVVGIAEAMCERLVNEFESLRLISAYVSLFGDCPQEDETQ